MQPSVRCLTNSLPQCLRHRRELPCLAQLSSLLDRILCLLLKLVGISAHSLLLLAAFHYFIGKTFPPLALMALMYFSSLSVCLSIFFFFETRSCYIALAHLELTM